MEQSSMQIECQFGNQADIRDILFSALQDFVRSADLEQNTNAADN